MDKDIRKPAPQRRALLASGSTNGEGQGEVVVDFRDVEMVDEHSPLLPANGSRGRGRDKGKRSLFSFPQLGGARVVGAGGSNGANGSPRPANKRIALPVRVEPKVFFANERTFLAWLHCK